MNNPMTVLAIIGSYRKGGIIDSAVDQILAAAREEGARTEKIFLSDRRIEFCSNCRICTQQEGPLHGTCPINDDMASLLDQIESADAIVLASPINFGSVTAIMKRFIERLACFVYWPWGMNSPKVRNRQTGKRAVVVTSSAAPALIARLATRVVGLLKQSAALLGARTVGVLFIGLAARQQKQVIGLRTCKQARLLGRKLVSGR